MSEFIYRFRSVQKLIDFKELENQSIYFCPPDDLNDPIEDFKDVFWRGDEILWSNLLKNYLLCLENNYLLIRVAGDNFTIAVENIPVFSTFDGLPTIMYKDKMDGMFQEFFNCEKIKILIKSLEARQNIRRNELLFYLDSIHMYCTQLIKKHDTSLEGTEGQYSNIESFLPDQIFNDNFFELLKKAKEDEQIKEIENVEEKIFDTIRHTIYQTKLISVLNNEELKGNKKFFFIDFPSNYVRQIEKLMFAPWYTSCFSKTPNNSSMWGYYADGHKGVCLKFKTTRSDDKSGILLKTITSISASRKESKKHYGNMFFGLHDINYESKVKPIDFFRSIGRLSYVAVKNQWYSDKDKKISPLVEDIVHSQEEWRSNYLKDFYSNIPIKTQEWKHEEETRLVHTDFLFGAIDGSDRVLNYRFCDLEGIIFGINMSEENKIKVLKIVNEICEKENFFDIKFYQASYDHSSGKIDIVNLGLLKITK